MSQQKIEIPGFGSVEVCHEGERVISEDGSIKVAVHATHEGCTLRVYGYPRVVMELGKDRFCLIPIGQPVGLRQGNKMKAVITIDERGGIKMLDKKDWPSS